MYPAGNRVDALKISFSLTIGIDRYSISRYLTKFFLTNLIYLGNKLLKFVYLIFFDKLEHYQLFKYVLKKTKILTVG